MTNLIKTIKIKSKQFFKTEVNSACASSNILLQSYIKLTFFLAWNKIFNRTLLLCNGREWGPGTAVIFFYFGIDLVLSFDIPSVCIVYIC